MTQDQDLVGIHVVMQKPGSAATAVVIVQRRVAALEAIDAIWTASGKVRIHDIVDNPTLIDAPNVVTASLCQVATGAALLQHLAPIHPEMMSRLAEIVPEALERPAQTAQASERRATAADMDPIEAAMGIVGRRPN